MPAPRVRTNSRPRERHAAPPGNQDHLLSGGQRVLASVVVLLLGVTIWQATQTSRASTRAVQATRGAQTATSLVGFTQRESLATLVAADRYTNGRGTRRELQLARAVLARRLATVDPSGRTAGELAGPEYLAALDAFDASWVDAPPGVLQGSDRPAVTEQVEATIIDFTEESKHLTDRYQQVADEVLGATSVKVQQQNRRLMLGLLATLGAATALVMWVGRDIRRRYREATDLEHRATHDALTGLVNRHELVERIHRAVRTGDDSGQIALLFIDLDGFKQVNDELGHDLGDQLLVKVADRFKVVAAAGRTVARLGGDEFVVLCDRVDGTDEPESVAAQLCAALSTPLTVGGQTVTVGASVGIALGDSSSVAVEDLMRAADAAMYRTKRAGRGGWTTVAAEDPAVLGAPSASGRAFRDQ